MSKELFTRTDGTGMLKEIVPVSENEMETYARQYQKEHRGKGLVSDITNYSFKFTTLPKKQDETPKSYYVMKSYFLNFS